MYTQCPECDAAFRVTAEVLKQAAGMVRCGSCGHAFNSLAYLSEQKPQPKIPDPALPELTPEPDDEPPAPVGGPKAISAEQSAALLKTLDQLAGDDIRIEDTGVEWRVLDDDNIDDAPLEQSSEHEILSDPEVTNAFRIDDDGQAAPASVDEPLEEIAATEVFDATGTVVDEQYLFDDQKTMVDELLDEAPTPVDEFLPADDVDELPSNMVDLGTLAVDPEPGDRDDTSESQTEDIQSWAFSESDDSVEAPAKDPLDVEPDEGLAPADAAQAGDTGVEIADSPDVEPEHATDADDETDTPPGFEPVPEAVAEPEEQIEDAAEHEPAAEPELRFDDNTPLPDDFLDDDVPASPLPLPQTPVAESPNPESLQKELELGKADEWQALLDEFGDLLATDLEPSKGDEDTPADDDWAELGDDAVDAELSRELEALDVVDDIVIDENATDSDAIDDIERAIDESLEETPSDDASADQEPVPDVEEPAEPEDLDDADEHEEVAEVAESTENDTGGLAEDEPAEEIDEPLPAEASTDNDDASEAGDALPVDGDGELDLTGILDPDDDGLEDAGERDAEPDEDGIPEVLDVGDEPEEQDVEEPAPGDPHYVPPQSEEEQTINMLIDQDLLAIAHEDEDGFTSTIVFEAGADPTDVDSIVMGADDDAESANDDEPNDDAPAAEASVAEQPTDETPADATAEAASGNHARIAGLGAMAFLLVLALGAQAVHNQRESLATDPRFGGTILSLYDTLGMPVTPEWDVSSWRIEKTQGSTDDSGRLLTIYAQVGNQGDRPLPYPTITVSVTDRYQESLGSLVVDPADYLATSVAATRSVAAGTSFEATIPIAELSPDAEGYLLNACYRQPSGPLRCVKEDFR